MVRTILWIAALGAAVLWLPVWLQILLFITAIISGPYRFFFILPAIASDALYAPGSVFAIQNHWMTLLVLGLLAAHWLIMRTLRISTLYGLEA
ncbi:MAG: hypothetical protein V4478_02935 [Patescibacteria group bacterium]